MFYVVISEKGGSQKRLEFDKKEITIGRVQGNDIIFPKGNVSKRHSRIVLKDGKFIIVDLKSTNGTFVNGRKITSPQMIKSSDRIYIGDFTLSVEEFEGESGNIGSEEPPAAPAPIVNNPPPSPQPPPPKQPSVAAAPIVPRNSAPMPEPKVPVASPTPPPSLKPMVVSSNSAGPSSSGKLGNGAILPSKAQAPSISPNRTTPKPQPVEVKPPAAKAAPVVTVQSPPAPKRSAAANPTPNPGDPRAAYLSAKGFILAKLAEHIDVTAANKPTPTQFDTAKKKIAELVRVHKSSISAAANVAQFTDEVCEEALGLGPLKALLQDKQNTEILVNGPFQITTVAGGVATPQSAAFSSELSLLCAVERLLRSSGHSLPLNPSSFDATLQDGANLLAMFPPYSPRGTTLVLRREPAPQNSLSGLISEGVLPESAAAFLEVCIRARLSIFISGASESGRSTLLQTLSSSFGPDERVCVLSDGSGLALQHPQSFSLHQSLSQRALLFGASRLVVKNVAIENTSGLVSLLVSKMDGSLVSGPGQNTQEAFERLCASAQIDFPASPAESVRELVGKAFLVMLHTMRFSDGSKRVVQISEVCQVADADGNATYAPSDLFVWDGERLSPTRQVPQFWPLLEARGEASGNAFFE